MPRLAPGIVVAELTLVVAALLPHATTPPPPMVSPVSAHAPSPSAAHAEQPRRAEPPTRDYLVYTVAESADQLALVRFGPKGITIERQQKVGMMPTEINGPHGISVSPDGQFYYISIAHGTPYGTFWKYRTSNDEAVARVTLGNFPATVQTTPDGALAFVVNFNLHGDMVPSSVSVVSTDEMVEIARIQTCTMPHGSRVNAAGTQQYSACMMDDMLVEIDTRALEVSRHFLVAKGKEMGMRGAPGTMSHNEHAGRPGATSHDSAMANAANVQCSPTWAQPGVDGRKIYVACNKSSEIVEVDAATWSMSRRWAAGDGVYNLAVSPDGKYLVATNKRGKSISVYDLASAREVARIPTFKGVVHGVVVSPDSRYAFVTEEGRGSEAGILEVFDLASLTSVATLELGQQAAGIDFFRMEPAR
ncbi:MAG: YncE family protein [Gemmatimonadaceae bacterium]|nr:YncE family protein [Gemmatimonadaceae bacterium]